MAHSDEIVVQDLMRFEPVAGIELQHCLKQVHKHQPIRLFHNFVRNAVVIEKQDLKYEEAKLAFVSVNSRKTNKYPKKTVLIYLLQPG